MDPVKYEVQHLWHEPTKSFFRSYYGNELTYFNCVTGEWVSPEEASMYPGEITDAYIVEE